MPYTIFNFDSTSLCKQQPSIFLHFLNRGIEEKIGLITEVDKQDMGISSLSFIRIRVAACFNFIGLLSKTLISSYLIKFFLNFFCKSRFSIFRTFIDRAIKTEDQTIQRMLESLKYQSGCRLHLFSIHNLTT